MTKHITDHATPQADGTRVAEYARIDREQAPKAANAGRKAQYRNAADNPDHAQRTKEYLRIDREQSS